MYRWMNNEQTYIFGRNNSQSSDFVMLLLFCLFVFG